jgi:hypothetical protein
LFEPILYIFFSAELVEEVVDKTKGALGFVDDYTRWSVCESRPIQRLRAKAVTNCVRTVSEEAACAEAYLSSTSSRLRRRIARF